MLYESKTIVLVVVVPICDLHSGSFSEQKRLHELDMVTVVTVDSGQVGLPDLSQLLLGELARVGVTVVVEPVSLLKPLELVSHHALKYDPSCIVEHF